MCLSNPASGPFVDAGPRAFMDSHADNDFYGVGVDMRRSLRIVGELLAARGGAGGGGGGDTGVRCPPNPQFIIDAPGGGGGGGGGALIVKVLGRIVVRAGGLLTANGGDGGGGSSYGSCGNAGGGGGGSGGMIVLMSGRGIHIAAHGAPYADAVLSGNGNGAYNFAIEADGGVGLRSLFQGNAVTGKYPGRGGQTTAAGFDFNPIGGFGGLGLVQLMTPAGDNLPAALGGDGTNTVLDDNVFFYSDDAQLDRGLASTNPNGAGAMVGAQKMRYLGWRGLIDGRGVGRDDAGNAIVLPRDNHGEGDIRPSPVLLPAPFGPLSRMRSRWIDTGATARRADRTGSDGTPRTLVERRDTSDPDNPRTNLRAGPTWSFAGLFSEEREPTGYVRYMHTTRGMVRDVPEVLPAPVRIAAITSNVIWRERQAHRVDLLAPSATLGQIPNRFAGYRAQLLGRFGEVLSLHRIVAHDGQALWLAMQGAAPDVSSQSVQIVADLLGFDGEEGGDFAGFRSAGGRQVPFANVRVGFAFHVNPNRPDLMAGEDRRRLPRDPSRFLWSLDTRRPDVQRAVRALGKTNELTEGATWVQYDLLFNTVFSDESAGHVDLAAPLSVSRQRPSVRWLVLPTQF